MRSPFLDGSSQPEPERVLLQAGSLSLYYEAGMLRYIRAGDHEIVRAIYAAVRDHNWGTVPALLRDVQIDKRADSFDILFTSDHRQGEIHYIWRGTISGRADSSITFTFEGEAQSTFKRNRIGFCVLHPAAAAGAPLVVEHTSGQVEVGAFPVAISPHQPFFDIRALTHTAAPGVRALVRMQGDTFEMEDQRNWVDASFKTYCTPLSLPFPVQVNSGDRVHQSVSVRLLADVALPAVVERSPELVIDLNAAHTKALPKIGVCRASHDEPLSENQAVRLRRLKLSHLRVDVQLDIDDMTKTLAEAWNEAQTIGAERLEIAAHVSADGDPHHQLDRLARLLHQHQIAARVIIFQDGALVTPEAIIRQMLTVFHDTDDAIQVGAGTRGYFTQVNRFPPTPRPPLTAYALNPQVHAFDNASLIETLPMLGETVRTARDLTAGAIAVTPITFKISWNPDATAAEPPTPPGKLPRRVDPRQMSLFGAGWTMGAIASLALAGADSLTFYETTGWLGLMEREMGSPLPNLFASIPGAVYPMYHVFAAVAEMTNAAEVLPFVSSQPLHVSGLALRTDRHLRLLIANHTQQTQSIVIGGVTGSWSCKTLYEANVEQAMRDPEAFRAELGEVYLAAQSLRLDVPPYALATLDQER